MSETVIFWLTTNVYGGDKLCGGVGGLCESVVKTAQEMTGAGKRRGSVFWSQCGGASDESSAGSDDDGAGSSESGSKVKEYATARIVVYVDVGGQMHDFSRMSGNGESSVGVDSGTLQDSRMLQEYAMVLIYECMQTCPSGARFMHFVRCGLVQVHFLEGVLAERGHDFRGLRHVFLAYDGVRDCMRTGSECDELTRVLESGAWRYAVEEMAKEGDGGYLWSMETSVEEYHGGLRTVTEEVKDEESQLREYGGKKLRELIRDHLRANVRAIHDRNVHERGVPRVFFASWDDVVDRYLGAMVGMKRRMFMLVCGVPALAKRAYEVAMKGGVAVCGVAANVYGMAAFGEYGNDGDKGVVHVNQSMDPAGAVEFFETMVGGSVPMILIPPGGWHSFSVGVDGYSNAAVESAGQTTQSVERSVRKVARERYFGGGDGDVVLRVGFSGALYTMFWSELAAEGKMFAGHYGMGDSLAAYVFGLMVVGGGVVDGTFDMRNVVMGDGGVLGYKVVGDRDGTYSTFYGPRTLYFGVFEEYGSYENSGSDGGDGSGLETDKACLWSPFVDMQGGSRYVSKVCEWFAF